MFCIIFVSHHQVLSNSLVSTLTYLKSMSDEDLIFYTLLTRGMAFQATIDTEAVLELGEESYAGDENVALTHH